MSTLTKRYGTGQVVGPDAYSSASGHAVLRVHYFVATSVHGIILKGKTPRFSWQTHVYVSVKSQFLCLFYEWLSNYWVRAKDYLSVRKHNPHLTLTLVLYWWQGLGAVGRPAAPVAARELFKSVIFRNCNARKSRFVSEEIQIWRLEVGEVKR